MTRATTELHDTHHLTFQQICYVNFVQERNIFPVFGSNKSELLHVKQMVNAIACTIELWYTQEVAKHERSVRVARGDSRVRL